MIYGTNSRKKEFNGKGYFDSKTNFNAKGMHRNKSEI